MKKGKWNKFLTGELPYEVLDGVLYQTGEGSVYKAWLPYGKEATVVRGMPITRIGTVPKELKDELPNTACELSCIGPY